MIQDKEANWSRPRWPDWDVDTPPSAEPRVNPVPAVEGLRSRPLIRASYDRLGALLSQIRPARGRGGGRGRRDGRGRRGRGRIGRGRGRGDPGGRGRDGGGPGGRGEGGRGSVKSVPSLP